MANNKLPMKDKSHSGDRAALAGEYSTRTGAVHMVFQHPRYDCSHLCIVLQIRKELIYRKLHSRKLNI